MWQVEEYATRSRMVFEYTAEKISGRTTDIDYGLKLRKGRSTSKFSPSECT
jgi:hypothetical protein